MNTRLAFSAGCALAALASPALAQLGSAATKNNTDIFVSEVWNISGGTYNGNAMLGVPGWISQEAFGITTADTEALLKALPNNIGDVSTFNDDFGFSLEFDPGIFRTDTTRAFIASRNGDGRGASSVTWTFDISGAGGVFVAIDAAAFGEYTNQSDLLPSFTFSIDGSQSQSLFNTTVTPFAFPADPALFPNEAFDAGNGTGANFQSRNALTLDGTVLSSTLTNIATGDLGTGSILSITFEAELNDRFASADAFIFQNLLVNEIPAPGAMGLLAIAGVASARRRRV